MSQIDLTLADPCSARPRSRKGCGTKGVPANIGSAREQGVQMVAAPRIPDSHRDLLTAATAVLATKGRDGLPQVTAVAFLHDTVDDLVKISLNNTRQKTKDLRRDPKTMSSQRTLAAD
jgi:hypothetical protein